MGSSHAYPRHAYAVAAPSRATLPTKSGQPECASPSSDRGDQEVGHVRRGCHLAHGARGVAGRIGRRDDNVERLAEHSIRRGEHSPEAARLPVERRSHGAQYGASLSIEVLIAADEGETLKDVGGHGVRRRGRVVERPARRRHGSLVLVRGVAERTRCVVPEAGHSPLGERVGANERLGVPERRVGSQEAVGDREVVLGEGGGVRPAFA